ncbi:ubiquitin-specific protease doa4, partial [Chytriomyces hyalinus]
RKWDLENMREMTFYHVSRNEWLRLDPELALPLHERMEKVAAVLSAKYSDPVVFVHYNHTERNLLQALFKHYPQKLPSQHDFCDLLELMRALVDAKESNSTRIYCPGRELKALSKWMWEGAVQTVPQNMYLLAAPGRMSELDVAHTVNLWKVLKDSPFEPAMSQKLSASASSSIGVVGLKNLGNTCFMNSVLQCLSATEPLTQYFLDGDYSDGMEGKLVQHFAWLIKAMWSGQQSVVTPVEFKEQVGELNPQFKGNCQHDSHEFLTFLLNAIHDDLNVAGGVGSTQVHTNRQEDEAMSEEQLLAWNNHLLANLSIVVNLFQGQLKSQLECLTCRTMLLPKFDTFMHLSVPLPPAGQNSDPVTLDKCLQKFVKAETLVGDNGWNCPLCKCKRNAEKTMSIVKLLIILLVHLKRFSFEGPFKSKIDTFVDFPVESMNLGKYLPDSGGRLDSSVYDLYAVSNHGGTLEAGHYTATVHDSSNNSWRNFSDSQVGVCGVNELK